MRRLPGYFTFLFIACADGTSDSATSTHGEDGNQDRNTEVAKPAAEENAPDDPSLGEPVPEEPLAAGFYVLGPLANDTVRPEDDPDWVQSYIELSAGGTLGLFGASSVVVMDPTGVRIAAQLFRWSPGSEALTLDDNTPWKNLRFAASDGQWLVGERGNGLASAQAFVWSEADGLVEITIENRSPVSARGASLDGRVIAGDAHNADGWRSYRWTATEGAALTELPEGYTSSGSTSLSADGNTVFGTVGAGAGPSQCFRWAVASGAQTIESAPVVDGWALAGCGVTHRPAADGSAIGATRSYSDPEFPTSKGRWEAFHWSEDSGLSTIDPLPGYGHSNALETSADGKVVYGQTWIDTNSTPGEQPFRWTAESGTIALGIPAGGRDARLLADDARNRSGISDDGQTVAGNTTFGVAQGFLWSVNEGLVTLRPLPSHTATQVTHLGASGRVAAGVSIGDEVEAVLWDVTGEPRSLRDMLAVAGVDIDDFDFGGEFRHDVAVFDDGKRVLGVGRAGNGVSSAWAATLP
jgi:uncharacterized membrane protein